MLRLPSTTISLTITEVKDFERRRRFKNYLAKEDVFGPLPLRPKVPSPTKNSQGSDHGELEQTRLVIAHKPSKTETQAEDIKLLSSPPSRQLKTSKSTGSMQPKEAGRNISSGFRSPEDTGRRITLPPPFSLERRAVSDMQSLPSGRFGIGQEGQRGSLSRELPSTPTKVSRMGRSGWSTPDQSTPATGTGQRIFSSAARFVGSIVRFSRNTSPSPSVPRTETQSTIATIATGSGERATDNHRVRVYDDSIPASLQPQTPMNLPEARHQSRLNGFHTAPARAPIMRQSVSRTLKDLGPRRSEDARLQDDKFQPHYRDSV
ncbi:hypothetical protein F4808DRAFT_465670 [Astrocystis sublimbata]|nr:hypothetical protein F4808DRAFT_465670 [Astrocystis sublimbata]